MPQECEKLLDGIKNRIKNGEINNLLKQTIPENEAKEKYPGWFDEIIRQQKTKIYRKL